MKKKPRIVFVCPTARDRYYLACPQIRDRYDISFLGNDIENPGHFDAAAFLREGLRKLKRAGRRIDGVVGNDDYPASLLGALLARSLKLPTPPLEAIFLCQHKYYSRLAQRHWVPEATPTFDLISLNGEESPEKFRLAFPYFVKPAKGYLSILSRTVRSKTELRKTLTEARRRIPPFVRPFNQLLELAGLKETFPVTADSLVAEQLLTGSQVTLEGFVSIGSVYLTEIFDSVFYPGTLSFRRFECPSKLPPKVQKRMFAIANRLIRGIALDNSFFNIEFVYNRRTDTIKIIEVNPRMACQFADMVEALHGTNPYEILLELALGRRPKFQRHIGSLSAAASFVLRTFQDQKVVAVPTRSEIAAMQRLVPEAHLETLVQPGKRLSEHFQQDDESYRYALINLGAPARRELFRRFKVCQDSLRFKFS